VFGCIQQIFRPDSANLLTCEDSLLDGRNHGVEVASARPKADLEDGHVPDHLQVVRTHIAPPVVIGRVERMRVLQHAGVRLADRKAADDDVRALRDVPPEQDESR